jgi:hypothetical protein
VFCDYNPENGKHDFGKINTTPQDMHDLFVEKDPDAIVMEKCSAAGWIVDIAKALGIETEVAIVNSHLISIAAFNSHVYFLLSFPAPPPIWPGNKA